MTRMRTRKRTTTKKTRQFWAVLFLILAVVSAGSLSAQKKNKDDATTRSVSGVVMDPDGQPVASAVVQLKDSRTLQVRSFITKEDGTYHFAGLKTDIDYQLKADRQELTSGWKTVSVFDNRKEPLINLKLAKK